jgi:hypothetical protein
MATKKSATKSAKSASTAKASVKRRSVNAVTTGQKASKGVPGQEQDAKRRLGNFSTMGEHARVGGRTSGIVGQTTKDFGTDNKRTKSTKPRTKHGPGSR